MEKKYNILPTIKKKKKDKNPLTFTCSLSIFVKNNNKWPTDIKNPTQNHSWTPSAHQISLPKVAPHPFKFLELFVSPKSLQVIFLDGNCMIWSLWYFQNIRRSQYQSSPFILLQSSPNYLSAILILQLNK